jgi:O-antigen ligase
VYRLRAHNTYLTSWLSFGVFGLITILWIILNFIRYGLHQTHPLAFVFILVAASTFFLEDTLETQMGASFFAFFFGLVCSDRPTAANKI